MSGRTRRRAQMSGLLFQCASQIHQHPLLLAPLFLWKHLGSYFLTISLFLYPATPRPAGSHGRVNFCWTGGSRQAQRVHCAPAPSGWLADCWNGTRQNVFTLLRLPLLLECVSEPVSVCTHTHLLSGVHQRGHAVVSQTPHQIEL